MTDRSRKAAPQVARSVSKREANRVAAAKVYVAASQRTGDPVPEWIQALARQPSQN